MSDYDYRRGHPNRREQTKKTLGVYKNARIINDLSERYGHDIGQLNEFLIGIQAEIPVDYDIVCNELRTVYLDELNTKFLEG